MFKKVLFFFYSPLLFSQNICFELKGNIDNSPIQYATVRIKNTAYGLFTDESGKFCLPSPIEKDTLIISAIGYKTKFIWKDKILQNNVIILEVDEIILKTLTVKPKVTKIIKLGYFKRNKIKLKGVCPNSGNPFATYIPNNSDIENGVLQSVRFKIDPRGEKFKLRVQFVENKINKPLGKRLSAENIVQDTEGKVFEINLEKYNILMPKDGLWILIESLGKYNIQNDFIPNKFGVYGKLSYKKGASGKFFTEIDSMSPCFYFLKSKIQYPTQFKVYPYNWSAYFEPKDQEYQLNMSLDIKY
jgi:CarboxypepD_reg-like domain